MYCVSEMKPGHPYNIASEDAGVRYVKFKCNRKKKDIECLLVENL